MIRNKQGVGVTQVFVYIVAVITFALIMIFGFKAIFGFIKDTQKIELVQFKSSLENSIEQLHSEFGAVRTEQFLAPGHFQQICFLDLDYQHTPEQLQQLCALDSRACVTWEESRGYNLEAENVFLTSTESNLEIPRIKVYRIEIPDQGFLCLPIRNGKFTLILEGLGDRTRLSGST